MKTSEQTDKLSEALALAQFQYTELKKDKRVEVKNKEGKFLYSYMFADLPGCLDSTRPALCKNGLSVVQGFEAGMIVTRICHMSGQWIETTYPVIAPKDDMQDFGGGITFARRYAYNSIVGIAAEDSRDGFDQKPKPQGQAIVTSAESVLRDNENIVDAIDEIKREVFMPGDYVMQFGKTKGKKLSDISEDMLQSTLTWCKAQNKPGVNVVTTQKFIEEYFRTKA